MKSIVSTFKNKQAFSFLVGLAWGAALGLILFCYLVPHGPKAIAMLRNYTVRMSKQHEVAQRNKIEFAALYASTTTQMLSSHEEHEKNATNPYMMGTVTSELQFLKDMKLHHEAAIAMAQQALLLPSISKEVRDLAMSIIKDQTTEIQKMTLWITSLK